MLKCDKDERGDVTVVALSGTLDASTSPTFTHESEALIAAGRIKVALNLERLEQIDNTGVAVVVGLRKRLHAVQGEVTIAGIQGQPGQIFKLLRLDRVFALCENVDSAVARLNA